MDPQLSLLWEFRVISCSFRRAVPKYFPDWSIICLDFQLFVQSWCGPQIANTPLQLKLPACLVIPINVIISQHIKQKPVIGQSPHCCHRHRKLRLRNVWLNASWQIPFVCVYRNLPPCRALSHTPASLHINQTQHCKLLPGMVSSQAQLCRSNLELMQTIIQAAREVKKTCQKTFADMRWNCSSIEIPADSPKYRPDLDRGMVTHSLEWQRGQGFFLFFFCHENLTLIVMLDIHWISKTEVIKSCMFSAV